MKRNTRTVLKNHPTMTRRHTQYRGHHIEVIPQLEGTLYLVYRATKVVCASRSFVDAKSKIDSLILTGGK